MGGGFPSPSPAVPGMVRALLVCPYWEEGRQGAGRSPECSRDRETQMCAVTSSLTFNILIPFTPFGGPPVLLFVALCVVTCIATSYVVCCGNVL